MPLKSESETGLPSSAVSVKSGALSPTLISTFQVGAMSLNFVVRFTSEVLRLSSSDSLRMTSHFNLVQNTKSLTLGKLGAELARTRV